MSNAPKKSVPAFLAQARAFYAEAFAHRRKSELANAMSEWGDLDESEQSFTLAHLAYLDLEAQAQTQTLLVSVRDLLDEIAEALTVAVEASFAEEDEEDDSQDEVEAAPLLFEAAPAPAPDIIDAEPAGESS